MSDGTELIHLVRNRDKLDEKDFEKYFNAVNKLIENTAKYTAPVSMDAQSIVTEEEFYNLCWDMLEGIGDNEESQLEDKQLEDSQLEDSQLKYSQLEGSQLESKGLINQLQNTEFPDDRRLKAFLKKVFENLLLHALHKKNPGFQTRKKQVNRVLKPFCVKKQGKDSFTKGKLWILTEFASVDVNPPNLEILKQFASEIPMPGIKYPKSENSRRGASIKDKDMRNYMLHLFRTAGGGVYAKDIDALLTSQFGFTTVTRAVATGFNDEQNEKNTDEYLEIMPCSRESVMVGACHNIMAEQLLQNMDEEIRDMIYYLYVKGMDQGEAAKKMGKSGSTITNMKKSLIMHISGYIQKDSSNMSFEEGAVVFEVIKELISKNRQAVS